MYRYCVAVALLVALSGCGSSSDSGGSPPVSRFGIVFAEDEKFDFNSTGFSHLNAIFGRYEEPVDFSEIVGVYRRDADSCVVTEENDGSSTDQSIYSVPQFLVIDAGAFLTFEAENGLSYQAALSDFYSVEPQPVYPLPMGLSVTIPGGDFPAMSTSIPDVSALTGFIPVSGSLDTIITPDTLFTWQAGSDPDARIIITTHSATSSSPENISPLDFYCDLSDDGFFEFSDEFKAILGSDYTNTGEFEAFRRSVSVEQQGDTALLLVRERYAE